MYVNTITCPESLGLPDIEWPGIELVTSRLGVQCPIPLHLSTKPYLISLVIGIYTFLQLIRYFVTVVYIIMNAIMRNNLCTMCISFHSLLLSVNRTYAVTSNFWFSVGKVSPQNVSSLFVHSHQLVIASFQTSKGIQRTELIASILHLLMPLQWFIIPQYKWLWHISAIVGSCVFCTSDDNDNGIGWWRCFWRGRCQCSQARPATFHFRGTVNKFIWKQVQQRVAVGTRERP